MKSKGIGWHWRTLNDIERHWTTLNSIKRCWTTLNDVKRRWRTLNNVEQCWTTLKDVEQQLKNMFHLISSWKKTASTCRDKKYKWWKIYVSAFTCPGDCSNAGFCDTSTGQCSCDPGRHDQDCSSKIQWYLKIISNLCLIHISTEFYCPGGTDQGCSNQGSCDDTTGICICNSGFEGASCHLSISKVI